MCVVVIKTSGTGGAEADLVCIRRLLAQRCRSKLYVSSKTSGTEVQEWSTFVWKNFWHRGAEVEYYN